MIRFCDAPVMANDEFADIASQLEEILSELNQVSDPTLRRRILVSMRLLMTEADKLAGQEGNNKEDDSQR